MFNRPRPRRGPQVVGRRPRVSHAERRGALQVIELPADGLVRVPVCQGLEGPNTLSGSCEQHFPPRPRGDPSGPNKNAWNLSSLDKRCFERDRENLPITVLCTGISGQPPTICSLENAVLIYLGLSLPSHVCEAVVPGSRTACCGQPHPCDCPPWHGIVCEGGPHLL